MPPGSSQPISRAVFQTLEPDSLVLVLTQSFEHDKAALAKALSNRCAYVGLLSSKTRRDALYEDMVKEGVRAEDLERISSPVGIDLHAQSDPEFAVGIAAEMVGFVYR